MDSEKQRQRRRVKTTRTISYIGLALAALTWAYLVWPTPYVQWSRKGFVYRTYRWGGHAQVLVAGRWQPSMGHEQPDEEEKEP